MTTDSQYQNLSFRSNQVTHHYGERVHILSSPLMLSLLAKLGDEKTHQPQVNELIKYLYGYLFDQSVDALFPKAKKNISTRMNVNFESEVVDENQKCVTVALARAGTYPSHLCYEKLNYLLRPELVRQDHFYISRLTNDSGEVSGVSVAGSKIGGPVEDSIVIFPDPMGATGGTMVEVYNHYKVGKSKLMIALHLIVTPEYLKKVTTLCPDLHIFCLRLDRGLSATDVLKTEPGKRWNEEIGLNKHQYIIPGAGGLGEVLNNSYC